MEVRVLERTSLFLSYFSRTARCLFSEHGTSTKKQDTLNNKRAVLTTGPIASTIIRLTGPMAVGMIGMVVFNLVDTYFIGQLGTEALAAMGYTFPVVMLQGAISMGLGVGASAVISRAIGRGDHEGVQRLTVDALVLSVTLVLVVVAAGLLTIDPLFRLIGAEGNTLKLVRDYMTIWYVGVPFVVIPMVGNNAIRAAGNTVIPSTIMMTAIVVNTALDPLLIFGIGPFPRMELAGAALATVIARAVTLVASLLFLRFKFDMLTARIPTWAQVTSSWKKILFIGAPAALTQAIIPLSVAAVTRMIAAYGAIPVAAFAVSMRLEMFVLSPIMALGAVLVPFIGQNLGAGNHGRIAKGIRFGFSFSLLLGVGIFITMVLLGKPIAAVFDKTPAVVRLVYRYVVIVSLSYGFLGAVLLTASFYNALNRPMNSVLITLFRAILLYVPLAWIGSQFWGLTGIFSGAAAASVIAGTVGMVWVRKSLARQ